MEQAHAPAGLICPNCRVDLVMSERRGVEIDYCPKCRGVWLDRGELDTIIERAVSEARAAAAPTSFLPQGVAQAVWPQQSAQPQTSVELSREHRHDDHDDDHRHNKTRPREGFFERFFD